MERNSYCLLDQLSQLSNPEFIEAVIQDYGKKASKEVVQQSNSAEVKAKILDNCPKRWESELLKGMTKETKFAVLDYLDDKAILLKRMPKEEVAEYVVENYNVRYPAVSWYFNNGVAA